MSFLEMLDIVNERLMLDGKEPIAFDHDCREGICGSCGMMINGMPHGPERGTATCQLHMRKFADGDHITIEPWRAAGLPAREGSHRRPQRVRPHHRGGRLHRRRHRRRARRQPDPDPEAGRRRGDGRGRVHRLRRVRRRVPERRRAAVHVGEARSTSTCCRRARPSAGTARSTWSRRWRPTSGRARTTASARPRAPRRSRSTSSRSMNKDFAKAQLKQRRLVAQTFP